MKTKIAVKYFGSLQEMANAFGVSKQLVHKFGEYLPECRAWQAESIWHRDKASAKGLRKNVKLKVNDGYYKKYRLSTYKLRQAAAKHKSAA